MSTTISEARPRFLYRPRGIAWAIIIITAVWAIMQWSLVGIVLLAVVTLFIIGLKKPLWAVAALLVSQMTITSFMIPTPFVAVSLRLLLLLITLYILRKELSRTDIALGPNSRKLITPTLILIVITLVSDMVNFVEFDMMFRDFRNALVGLLFIILIPAVINNTKQLKTICSVFFIVSAASAIIGVMQHYNILGMEQATLLPGFLDTMNRVPGMGETELELAYFLPATLMVICGIFISKGLGIKDIKLLLIPALLMLLATYFTYTRSALFGIGCGIVSLIIAAKTRIRWEMILIALFFIFGFLTVSEVSGELYLSGRSESNQEESSVARLILWQAGVAIAVDNPVLGIGGGQFINVSPQYANRIDQSLIEWEGNRYWSYTTLGNDEPHNDFVMMWVSHGTPALMVFLWLHFAILRNLMTSFRISKSRFIRGLSIGLVGALATYVINSFYHNLLATLPLLWILAAFSLVTVKLAAKEKQLVPQTPVS